MCPMRCASERFHRPCCPKLPPLSAPSRARACRYAQRLSFPVRSPQPGAVRIECEDDLWRHYALSKVIASDCD